MKTFRLQPHEIGFLKLLYSTFAGLDYATANATTQAKNRNDKRNLQTIREVQIQAQSGLASEYIRAALVVKHLIAPDEKVVCMFDPSDDNTDGQVVVMDAGDFAKQRAAAAQSGFKCNVKGK